MRMAYWNKRFDGARRADLGGQPVDSLVRDATNPNATPR
jgi:hypothetical protein